MLRSERLANEREGLEAVGFVMCPTASKLKEYYIAQLSENGVGVWQDVILEIVNFVCAGDGEMVDAKDMMDNWALAYVTEIDEEGRRCKVHYIGWSLRYDEWISCESPRIQPAFSQTLFPLEPNSLPLPSVHRSTRNIHFEEMEAFGFNRDAVREVIGSFPYSTCTTFNAIICWSTLGPSSVPMAMDSLFRKVLKHCASKVGYLDELQEKSKVVSL
eukprot:TRINITY_DN3312_c0_g2_i3.p1 TRINITY_DN3312_c0_g2~~TRINITY_DN3312_c0_g2_i3.p1  ORF type:complete len:216 (-),score=33.50 TRINITY_DN3312_c0_g2_i3:10-657(-)